MRDISFCTTNLKRGKKNLSATDISVLTRLDSKLFKYERLKQSKNCSFSGKAHFNGPPYSVMHRISSSMNSIKSTFLWISVLYFLYIHLKILKYLQLLLCQVFDPPHCKRWAHATQSLALPVVLLMHICCQTSWLLANSRGKCQVLSCPSLWGEHKTVPKQHSATRVHWLSFLLIISRIVKN